MEFQSITILPITILQTTVECVDKQPNEYVLIGDTLGFYDIENRLRLCRCYGNIC